MTDAKKDIFRQGKVAVNLMDYFKQRGVDVTAGVDLSRVDMPRGDNQK